MPALSVIPEPTGADMVPAALRPDETKKLLAEFKKAQSSEAKALDHRQKMELKELKASQSARQKEWENKEKLARHEFFRLHSKGPERRAYIQDFLERRKAFVSLLSDERSKRVHEQEIRRNSLKEDQASRFQEFQSFLGRGERPPARLWPQLGG